jgi:ribosome maturation factor RimP
MKFRKKNVEKDLDGWINLPVKVILHEDGFYQGFLVEEQKNGILIKCSGKRVYIPYESILSLEELTDVSEDV